MTISLSNTLALLNARGKILFTHENEDMVSFRDGDVIHRTNQAFIDQLEAFAQENKCPVIRSPQVERGSARRNLSITTGTYLVRLFAKF